MDIVTIDVDRSELIKLSKYRIVAENSALRSFISHGDVGELDYYEIDQIINLCIKAIKLDYLGVDVDIELGRSPQNLYLNGL